MACWSCGAGEPGGDRCAACGALQPAPAGEDLFAALGLPRRFAQEPEELERRFRERARAVHPDRFARAPARERRVALLRAARLNEAHRRLRAPRERAAYLLEVLAAGDEPPPYGKGAAGGEPLAYGAALLEEQLALRERIEAARGDAAELGRIAGALEARLAGIDAALGAALAVEAPPPAARQEAARLLAEARLLERALASARVA